HFGRDLTGASAVSIMSSMTTVAQPAALCGGLRRIRKAHTLIRVYQAMRAHHVSAIVFDFPTNSGQRKISDVA
ncbi:MAG: hypothetical protein ACOCX2_09980, partial [Armatimonadota bacterium]